MRWGCRLEDGQSYCRCLKSPSLSELFEKPKKRQQRLSKRHWILWLTSVFSNLRPDYPRRVVCGAIWRVPMKVADRSWSMHEQAFATFFFLPRPWHWPDDLHIRTWPVSRGDIYRVCENELPTSLLSKVIVWHRYVSSFSHRFIIIIITIIITTFTMHHSISVPLQTQNLPFP